MTDEPAIERARRTAALLLLLSGGVAWSADSSTPFDFEMGAKVGVNLAKVTGTSNRDGSMVSVSVSETTGVIAGPFMSFGLGRLALEPEVLFTEKGFQESAGGPAPFTIVHHLNYVEVPVLLKVWLIPVGAVRPYLAAGPALSYLLSAKSRVEQSGSSTTINMRSTFSSYDYAAVLDAGLAWSVGPGVLSADVRYTLGLDNVAQTAGVNTKNSVLSILLGCSL